PLSASVGVRRVEVDDAGPFLVGLSMPLPLWDRRRDAARAADARVRAAELAASRLRAEVSSDVAVRLETLDLLLVQLAQVDGEVIPELQSAAEGLRTAYQLGSVSYPDLLEVQRALVAVQQEQNDTRRAIAAEVIAIEALTGMTIEEMSHE
ncbi:MAG TPA: TolC family protein, partial [Candidatus Krumholzibacteria bacterium]|nr:TolC family protein [Candidatus Krumholzibacteria bacterium]